MVVDQQLQLWLYSHLCLRDYAGDDTFILFCVYVLHWGSPLHRLPLLDCCETIGHEHTHMEEAKIPAFLYYGDSTVPHTQVQGRGTITVTFITNMDIILSILSKSKWMCKESHVIQLQLWMTGRKACITFMTSLFLFPGSQILLFRQSHWCVADTHSPLVSPSSHIGWWQ